MDLDTIQVRGKSRSKTKKDIARAKALLRQIRQICRRESPLRGLTPGKVLERLRQTREQIWRERHASRTR